MVWKTERVVEDEMMSLRQNDFLLHRLGSQVLNLSCVRQNYWKEARALPSSRGCGVLTRNLLYYIRTYLVGTYINESLIILTTELEN